MGAQAHGTVDAFVEFVLQDPTREKEERQKSKVVPNEPDPRWGDKFDFVMADANSILHVNVYDQKGSMENLVSLKTLAGASRRSAVVSCSVVQLSGCC